MEVEEGIEAINGNGKDKIKFKIYMVKLVTRELKWCTRKYIFNTKWRN